jgi:hypothetical protein
MATLCFFGESAKTATWPIEFWNRGQELEPCTLRKETFNA